GDNQGSVTIDEQDRTHVVIPVAFADGRLAVVYLRGENGRWQARELRAGAAYAVVAAIGGDSLVFVYVSADTSALPGVNGLFVAFSSDAGAQWTSAKLV